MGNGGQVDLAFKGTLTPHKNVNNFLLAELQPVQLPIHVPYSFTCGRGLASGLFLHSYITAEFVPVQQIFVTWDMRVERGQSHVFLSE